jgi:hypothetical protein
MTMHRATVWTVTTSPAIAYAKVLAMSATLIATYLAIVTL